MTSSDLTMENDYRNLAIEIQQTIDRHNNSFKQLKSSQYSDSRSYESAFNNYKISKEVEDVEDKRQEIWNILTKKYNENTKMRKFFYDEIKNVDIQLHHQQKELDELMGNYHKLKTQSDKLASQLKNGKYNMHKNDYYVFMYKVLLVVQSVVILLIILSMNGMMSKNTVLILVFIAFIACLIFMVYYIYIANLDRNKFSWTKFDMDDSTINRTDRQKQCNSSLKKPKKKTDQQLQLDEDVKKIIEESKKQDKCSTN
jgi:hypothetical protein